MTSTLLQKNKDNSKSQQVITILVNQKEVLLQERRVTGLEIKQAAIDQGVAIQIDFILFRVNPGGQLKQIGDNEVVTLHQGLEFRAVAPDDNS